jgi:PleD family two-component response regulator
MQRRIFGGEEFMVFLPHTNLSIAYSISERLHSVLSDTPFKSKDLSPPRTIISVGTAASTKVKATLIDTYGCL